MKTAENSPTSLVAKTKVFLLGTPIRKRVTFATFTVLFLTGVGVVGWLALPLVIMPEANEAFPVTGNANDTSMPADGQTPGAMMIPEPILTGQFVGSDGGHRSEGTANIFELEDGSRVLRFESDFSVTNGPRLVVWLSDLEELDGATGNPVGSSPENYITLDSLTAPRGSQNYTIPPDVDLDDYNSVVIWCAPFRVAFAIAPLEQS